MADRLIEIADGEIIFSEDEPSDYAFVVESGYVEVFTIRDNKHITIAELPPGELFGEMGVFDGRARSASSRGMGPCTLRMISAKDFHERLNSDPAFSADVMGKVIRRLRDTTDLLTALETEEENYTKTKERREALPQEPDPIPERPVYREPDLKVIDTNNIVQPDSAPQPDRHLEPSRDDEPEDIVSGPLRPTPTAQTPVLGANEEDGGEETKAGQSTPTAIMAAGRVLIARIDGPEGEAVSKQIATLIEADGTISALRLAEAIIPPDLEIEPEDPIEKSLADADRFNKSAVFTTARQHLIKAQSNVMIVGKRAENGVVRLHFLTPWADDTGRMGGFAAHDCLSLETDQAGSIGPLDGMFAKFLLACIIAATQLRDPTRLAVHLPGGLKAAEQAGLFGGTATSVISNYAAAENLICYGNVTAKLAALTRDNNLMQDAADTYQAAIERLNPRVKPSYAVAHLHRSVVLSTIAERTDDEIVLERALADCKTAAANLSAKSEPITFITAQSRLGAICYRMALRDGQVDTCRDGVQAFKTALGVCDRDQMADIWADVMNGLGQLLQLLGRYARKTDFVLWSVQVCRTALSVRTQDRAPLAWARTQNNLCSALVLLATAERDNSMLQEAIEGFVEAQRVFGDHKQRNMASLVSRNRIHAEEVLNSILADPNTELNWWTG